jgi:hypothetical protein
VHVRCVQSFPDFDGAVIAAGDGEVGFVVVHEEEIIDASLVSWEEIITS